MPADSREKKDLFREDVAAANHAELKPIQRQWESSGHEYDEGLLRQALVRRGAGASGAAAVDAAWLSCFVRRTLWPPGPRTWCLLHHSIANRHTADQLPLVPPWLAPCSSPSRRPTCGRRSGRAGSRHRPASAPCCPASRRLMAAQRACQRAGRGAHCPRPPAV